MDYIVDKSVFAYKDGYVKIPDGPGSGIEVDEEHVRNDDLQLASFTWSLATLAQ